MSRVCVAITGDTAAEMLERADTVVRENAFLEFRLDYLEKPLSAIPRLRDFLYERSEVTAVATCRRVAGGGKFKGSAATEVEILTQAALAGFHLIDLEIETAEALNKAQFATLRATLAEKGTGLILSSHDFNATRDLDKTLERLQKHQPEFIKIVSTANCLADNMQMLRFLEKNGESTNLIGICMGEQGLVSRVLGVRAGSIFTFAAASEGEETGPGQMAARTLLETYRIDQVETSTRVYGVVGNPVRHSLSPIMQNTAFRRETVNAVFLALETKKLSDLLKLVHELPVHGLAVTMPFKEEILQHLEKTDPLSAKIGACNTVVRSQDGRLFGFNTDVAAIVRPLERRLALRGAKVLVLGAGGAARAAVFGLVEKGAEVFILNRTPETAQKLARQAKAKTIRRELVAKTQFDVILNATPAGMNGQKTVSILQPHEVNARIVFDTVYNPLETPLIRMAREKGIAVVTGVEMFVQQGARQFEIWTGKPAPEEEMLRVAIHALRRRGDAAQPAIKAAEKTAPIAPQASPSTTAAAPKPAPVAKSPAPQAKAIAKPAVRKSAAAPPIVSRNGIKAKQAGMAAKPTNGHGAAKSRPESKARPGSSARTAKGRPGTASTAAARKTAAAAKPAPRGKR
jgi:3-dehydroquinate dehydratase/shikimate dehydrogenase